MEDRFTIEAFHAVLRGQLRVLDEELFHPLEKARKKAEIKAAREVGKRRRRGSTKAPEKRYARRKR